ncbi:M20/M25/M40 family metallo-hydrolase [Chloracidobacterium validum]|uniref:M20/M25/M40 family metallo-hydrolase n=1 Tax=Chloracidobacterium validum TaxID=2821543 RepID=A0ABX8BCN0_9BACT|nr:M20/M25/M40 family metallo-hydrolase [Chloracidobacterium validum]QUW03403.1 M20/M25/M40 family metallo-hydrolase [Chloracidobacterium validum]
MRTLRLGVVGWWLLWLVIQIGAQAANPQVAVSDELRAALARIQPAALRAHTELLSDDLFEGRAPGARGGLLAAKYIATQFQAYGLEPRHGSYFQNVPITNLRAQPTVMTLRTNQGQAVQLAYGSEFTAQSGECVPEVKLDDVPVIFAGYGIVAPEYDWNDYKDVDVRGKIVMLLVNDPGLRNPNIFQGRTLTYYGRWTYKYEEAARQGARGVLLIHTTESATYPWQVVQSSNTGVRSELVRDANSPPVVALKSWITDDAAVRVAKLTGKNLAMLIEQAERRDFRPVSLDVTLSLDLKSEVSTLESPNVVGWLPGRDPQLRDECVVVTAHYDHFGVKEDAPTGQKLIYHGALDNASGVAALLAMAEALAKSPWRPRRSVLFLAVTAEEQGLLGAQYYCERPLIPLEKTAANINLDEVNVFGRTRDFVPLGAERSTLGKTIDALAKLEGLVMKPDPFPQNGSFFRSDHFCFAKAGVPCLSLNFGVEVEGKPEGWGKQRFDTYVRRDYHQPTDVIQDDWDFQGAAQHAQFALLIVATIADDPAMPDWLPGEAFQRKKT